MRDNSFPWEVFKWLENKSGCHQLEIALLAIKGETTLNEICKRYKVALSQVYAWKKQLLEQESHLFTKNDKAAETAAIELVRKQSKL